jgi:predicted Zn-dependent protease
MGQDQNRALIEFEILLQQWTSTSFGRRSFLASIPVLLAACSTPQHRQREGNLTGTETSLSYDDERRMTQEVMPQMRKDYPAIPNPTMQNYIANLGSRVVRANGLEGNPYNYNFTVVGVPYVNAFALPAGTVFVTAPLIAMADSEAELAGVVGHEVGHIKARHTAIRMEKAKKAESSSWKYAAGGGVLGGIAGFGLGKLLCPPQDNTCLAKATAVGAAAGAGGGLLVQKYGFMANSREDEMEADRVGFRTSVKAGWDKDHVGSFYSKLLAMEQESKKNSTPVLGSLQDALSTHPPSNDRVTQMRQMAQQEPKAPSSRVSSKDFDQVRKLCQEWVKANPPKQS